MTVMNKENNKNPEAAVNSWKELCAKVMVKIPYILKVRISFLFIFHIFTEPQGSLLLEASIPSSSLIMNKLLWKILH